MAAGDRRTVATVAALIAAGTLLRVLVALRHPSFFDLDNILAAGRALGTHGLDVYGAVNDPGARVPVFPYPPAFLPWAWLSGEIGLERLVARLPLIAADAAIAWMVFAALRARGAAPRLQVLSVALLTFGPVLIATAGYWGQLDGLAMAFGLAAVLVWDRDGPRRALWAGLLIGVGTAIKQPPAFLLLALVPTARSPREWVTAAAVAALVVGAALAPFVAADPGAVIDSLAYSGFHGQAGLSALLQPGIVQWTDVELSGPVKALGAINGPVVLIGAAAAAFALRRARASTVTAAAVIYLVVYVLGVNWIAQYAVWSLPFLLIAGHWRYAAALSVVYALYAWYLAAPLWTRLSLPGELPPTAWVVMAWVLWLAWAAGAAYLLRPASPPRR